MCDEPEIKESINLEKNTTINEFIPFWANDPNIFLPGAFSYNTSTAGSELLIIYVQ
jgi:hypothetical protein